MEKKKIILSLMIIAGLSKIVGFAREIVLANFWGASNISDAYLISTTIPTTVFTFIGAGVTTGFIPIFTEIKEIEGKDKANEFVNRLLGSTLIICCVLIFIGELYCEQLVKLFASGFDEKTFNIAVAFTRVSLFEIGFTTIMYIMTAYLQSEGSFIVPACASFPMNIITICSIWLSSRGNYYFLCLGCLAASFVQAAFLIPFAFKKNFKIVRVNNFFTNVRVKELFLLALPTIIGTSVNDINILVDRTLASSISVGGISALNYASKINSFLQGIVVLSIVSYIFPKIASLAIRLEYDKLNNIIDKSVLIISFFLIPASCIMFLFSEKIIAIVFGHGAFNRNAVLLTSSVLALYSISMIANGLREVFSRVLFAFKDSKTPMINGAIGMGINVLLNFLLSKIYGINGLALATSISSFCILFLMIYSTIRKDIWMPGKELYYSLLKILFLSLTTCPIIMLIYNTFYGLINSSYFSMLLSILFGFLVYMFGALLLKIKVVAVLLPLINKKY